MLHTLQGQYIGQFSLNIKIYIKFESTFNSFNPKKKKKKKKKIQEKIMNNDIKYIFLKVNLNFLNLIDLIVGVLV